MRQFNEWLEKEKSLVGEEDNETKVWGLTTDGWDAGDLSDVGLDEVLDRVEMLSYEIKNARRGSYAKFGDTIEDLVEELDSISEQFADVAAGIEAEAKKNT
jgi:hypothetical protein